MAGSMLGMTPGEFSRPLIDFHTKLAGADSQEWWDGFKRFLRKENPWSTTRAIEEQPKPEWGSTKEQPRFLMTVTLGRRKNGKEYQENLESGVHKVESVE